MRNLFTSACKHTLLIGLKVRLKPFGIILTQVYQQWCGQHHIWWGSCSLKCFPCPRSRYSNGTVSMPKICSTNLLSLATSLHTVVYYKK